MSTLAEYRERLATEPLTPLQLGAIHGEWRRLGLHYRPERLRLSAALAQVGAIGTTKDLTMGEAGRVVGQLRQCATLADARALASSGHAEPVPARTGLLAALWRALAA
jgi:hypothetical protein